MSLINDALKKAQKQRTGEAAPSTILPSVGGEPAAKIAKRAKPVGFNTLLVRVGLIGGSALIVLVGGFFAVRLLRSTPAALASKPAPVVETPPSQTTPPVGAPTSKPVADPSVTFTLPVAAAPVVEPSPAPVNPAPNPVVTAAVVPAEPTPAPAVVPAPPPIMSSKAVAFIEDLRIAGIRAAGADSKVLMNDRVYRIGDFVDRDLGLKLVGIASSSLDFENAQGATYTRNF